MQQESIDAMVALEASAIFLAVNVVVLAAILALNRSEGAKGSKHSEPATPPPTPEQRPGMGGLSPSDILGWEFEYARTTASEAMQDRLTMVNFYLLATGVIISGVVVVLGRETDLPGSFGTVLLWLLCGVGWIHFLKIIRLRQAWHESARTMNRIKEFYIEHTDGIASNELRQAFHWKPDTLPAPGKPWTVFFYSAMLIGFLDSAAYVAGGALLDLTAALAHPWQVLGPLCVLGLIFFALHVVFYFAFLLPEQGK